MDDKRQAKPSKKKNMKISLKRFISMDQRQDDKSINQDNNSSDLK